MHENSKPLLGYSDCTSVHLALFELGLVSLYGGAVLEPPRRPPASSVLLASRSCREGGRNRECDDRGHQVMTQFALSGPRGMDPYTAESVLAALFASDPAQPVGVRPAETFQDGYLECVSPRERRPHSCFLRSWADPANASRAGPREANPGWEWHGVPATERHARSGLLWGGCLETLFTHLANGTCLPDRSVLVGAVLFVETSETCPSASLVYAFFQTLGELGWLARFAAILVGRPQTRARGIVLVQPPHDRDSYKRAQKRAVLRAVDEYCSPPRRDHSSTPPIVVFDLDFGHTEPQVLVPMGGTAHVSGHSRTIAFSYQRAVRPRGGS